jgi:hypothetical protein
MTDLPVPNQIRGLTEFGQRHPKERFAVSFPQVVMICLNATVSCPSLDGCNPEPRELGGSQERRSG